MKIASVFTTSLILVVILYLISVCLTFLIPNYADAPFSEATPSMFFGWIWYSVFSLVQFITTWGPIVVICVVGGIGDIILKLLSNIWNAIPILADLIHWYYPGVTFQNSINTILTINENAYVTILSLGTELEWQGAEAAGYWVNQGAGLLGNLGYFSSGFVDIGQQIYDGLIAEGQEAAQAIIDAGQASADALVAEAKALGTLIGDKVTLIQLEYDGFLYDFNTEGYWVTEYPLGVAFTFFVTTKWPDLPAAAEHLGNALNYLLELLGDLILELLNFQ